MTTSKKHLRTQDFSLCSQFNGFVIMSQRNVTTGHVRSEQVNFTNWIYLLCVVWLECSSIYNFQSIGPLADAF